MLSFEKERNRGMRVEIQEGKKENERAVTEGLGYCIKSVHNNVISGFRALLQAGAPMAGLEPATEGSLQISGRTHKPSCHQRPLVTEDEAL
ncbi:hypothetical protein PoB_003743500 [Plakobranchus ocellatus]|uniref:Uncharacterized protein n=1 Tax=Plakobranchus ocellatus TaxID=259542 RepID=A0AAV4ARL7_9GAST|nr:hypothetical protein PoB_003743500 [Plakobranchus ocellatus]